MSRNWQRSDHGGLKKITWDYLVDLAPNYFELYNLADDKGQKTLSQKFPERVNRMKKEMIRLQKEWLKKAATGMSNNYY